MFVRLGAIGRLENVVQLVRCFSVTSGVLLTPSRCVTVRVRLWCALAMGTLSRLVSVRMVR